MIKIEATTLEDAYSKAATELNCSVTELVIEVVQYPSSGVLGLFRKKAIIVATKKPAEVKESVPKEAAKTDQQETPPKPIIEEKNNDEATPLEESAAQQNKSKEQTKANNSEVKNNENTQQKVIKQQIEKEISVPIEEAVEEIRSELLVLFSEICFELDDVIVRPYDESTVYVELNGNDAALLIGKEGYRYKALSYILFNWINMKYGFGLRLEIAQFLQNQEEAVHRYLEGVKEDIDTYGRAQTKILDGVLVQIALKELRATYPDKYVAIRKTKDGLKYIIVNDYNNY